MEQALGDLHESLRGCKDHMLPLSACSECVHTSGQSSNSKPILPKQVYRAIENLSEIFDKYITTHPNAYEDYVQGKLCGIDIIHYGCDSNVGANKLTKLCKNNQLFMMLCNGNLRSHEQIHHYFVDNEETFVDPQSSIKLPKIFRYETLSPNPDVNYPLVNFRFQFFHITSGAIQKDYIRNLKQQLFVEGKFGTVGLNHGLILFIVFDDNYKLYETSMILPNDQRLSRVYKHIRYKDPMKSFVSDITQFIVTGSCSEHEEKSLYLGVGDILECLLCEFRKSLKSLFIRHGLQLQTLSLTRRDVSRYMNGGELISTWGQRRLRIIYSSGGGGMGMIGYHYYEEREFSLISQLPHHLSGYNSSVGVIVLRNLFKHLFNSGTEIGSGFLCSFKIDEKVLIGVVTAAHVIRQAKEHMSTSKSSSTDACEILIVFPHTTQGDPLDWNCEDRTIYVINLTQLLNSDTYRGIFDNKGTDGAFVEIESHIIQEKGTRKIFQTESQFSEGQDIIVIQFPEGVHGWDYGKVSSICPDKFGHTVNTLPCSSGSPIMKWSESENSPVIGIHVGFDESKIIGKSTKGPKVSENEGVPIKNIINHLENDYHQGRNKEQTCYFNLTF